MLNVKMLGSFLVLLATLWSSVESQSPAATALMQRLMADPRKISAYPFTITFATNGPVFTGRPQPDMFRIHHELIGNNFPEDVIAEGKKAARFFLERFGVDYTNEADEVYYSGSVSKEGTTFNHFMVLPETFYRVVSATDLHSGTRFNNFISDGGWILTFNEEFISRGSYRGVLPATSAAVYGNYAFRTGVNAEHAAEQNKEFPGPVMNIHYQSKSAFFPPDTLTGALIIDCDVENEFLGRGSARGISLPQVTDVSQVGPGTLYAGANFLTFPGSIPHNSP